MLPLPFAVPTIHRTVPITVLFCSHYTLPFSSYRGSSPGSRHLLLRCTLPTFPTRQLLPHTWLPVRYGLYYLYRTLFTFCTYCVLRTTLPGRVL